MGQRIVNGKKDAEKSRDELIDELNILRGYAAQDQESATRNKARQECVERYCTLFDNVNDAIFILDGDGRFTDVNQVAIDHLGYNRAEYLTMKISDICAPDYAVHVPGRINEIRKNGAAVFESALVRRDGSVIPVEVSARLIEHDDRPMVLSIVRDITKRKRTEEALRESEEKYRALAESSTAAIVLYQGEWLVSVNPAAERITGYSKDELLKMRLIDIIHPDFKEVVQKRAFARQRGEPEPPQYETMIITNNGEARWVLLSVGLMLYRGKPAGVVTLLDITERKRAEEALRKSEAHLAKSQKIARLGSYDWDLVHNTDEWSDELFYILGIRPGEVKPSLEAYMQFVYPDDRETVNKHLDDMLNKHIYTGGYEVRIVRPDGAIRWTRLDGEFIRDESGKIIRLFGTIMDITERKRAEDELGRSKRLAELYLDLMGHDITNMNQALMGYLEVMGVMRETGEIDKSLIDNSIEVINRSSRMIEDVKKLTRLQAGKVPPKDVDLGKILSKVKARYTSVPNKPVTINYTPDENCIVQAGDQLEDVFDNLVDNAIRHSGEPVTVDIGLDKVTVDGCLFYRVTVADTGPGIPDDMKRKIFMTSAEAIEKMQRRGFGLYLVRTLIDYYHGKVWVEDRVPGDHTKGARFVVMLPAIG